MGNETSYTHKINFVLYKSISYTTRPRKLKNKVVILSDKFPWLLFIVYHALILDHY